MMQSVELKCKLIYCCYYTCSQGLWSSEDHPLLRTILYGWSVSFLSGGHENVSKSIEIACSRIKVSDIVIIILRSNSFSLMAYCDISQYNYIVSLIL